MDNVDAVWLGDASGRGDDHFDLVAPALEKGLPTLLRQADRRQRRRARGRSWNSPGSTRRRSCRRACSATNWAWSRPCGCAIRPSSAPLEYVIASMAGGYSPEGWFIYGQHPVWTVMTLCGPGVEAVSLYARQNTAHGLVTYTDRMPAEIWYGRPDISRKVLPHARSFPEAALRVHAGHRGRLLVRPSLRDVPHGRHLPRDDPTRARNRCRTRRSWK